MAEEIGREAALQLAYTFAPGRLYVPKRPEGGEIERVIGSEAALKLAKAYGGYRIELPMAKPALIQLLRREGKEVTEIAKLLRMDLRTVRRHVNGGGDDRQMKLSL
jgi:hypothetical protein